MKKIIYLAAFALIVVSCASYRSLDLSNLTTGMTKNDVRSLIGPPDRVLAVNQTDNGYQEVLEYRTSDNEVYALEFWNDYLTGYEFLYDDVIYVPSAVPPMWYPEAGRPLFPPGYYPYRPNRPNRPNRPGQSTGTRPGTTRPDNPNTSRPNTRPTTRSSTRPTQEVRPSTTRPSNSRPSTPTSSSRPEPRTSSSRPVER